MKSKSKNIYNKRVIFNIKPKDSDIEVPITSGGVILYRRNKELELLLITNRGKYEDLGGRADISDKNIYETVAREAYEESNNLINKKSILDRIKTSEYFISKTAKYIVFIIEANQEESKLLSEQFGNIEIHDNIPRIISWIPISEFLDTKTIKDKMNFRLKNRYIFEYLKSLKYPK